MATRKHSTLAALPFALIIALAAGSPAPAAGQAAGAREPRDAVGPERTALARPTVEGIRPSTLDPIRPLAGGNAEASLDRARLAIVTTVTGDSAGIQFSRPQRVLDVAIVALGGSLVVGALAHYSAGSMHWGMTPSEFGAFGVGATLAAWGGVRVARWGSGGR